MIKRVTSKLLIIVTAAIIIGMSAGIAWSMQQGASKLPLRQYFSVRENNAIWDWRGPSGKSDQQLRQLSEFLYLHQIKSVYVDMGSYVSIMQMSKGPQRDAKAKEYEAALTRYVSAMQKRQIKVYASAGDVEWSKPDNIAIPRGLLEYAQDYNNKHKNTPLAGFEFDIESYNKKVLPKLQ